MAFASPGYMDSEIVLLGAEVATSHLLQASSNVRMQCNVAGRTGWVDGGRQS